jgi:hypothetical protein
MLDKVLLWGADQVCNMAGVTGLAKSFGLAPGGICIYSGSYWVGTFFWVAIVSLTILVMNTLRRKW